MNFTYTRNDHNNQSETVQQIPNRSQNCMCARDCMWNNDLFCRTSIFFVHFVSNDNPSYNCARRKCLKTVNSTNKCSYIPLRCIINLAKPFCAIFDFATAVACDLFQILKYCALIIYNLRTISMQYKIIIFQWKLTAHFRRRWLFHTWFKWMNNESCDFNDCTWNEFV